MSYVSLQEELNILLEQSERGEELSNHSLFYKDSKLYFPSPEEIAERVRLLFAQEVEEGQLESAWVQILFLVVKAEWERYSAQHKDSKKEFKLPPDLLVELLRRFPEIIWSPEELQAALEQMLNAKLYLRAMQESVVSDLLEEIAQELIMSQLITPEEQEQLFKLRQEQRSLLDKIAVVTMEMAELRHRAQFTRVEWLKIFGDAHKRLQTAMIHLQELNQLQELRGLYPEAKPEELKEEILEYQLQMEESVRLLEREIKRAQNLKHWKSDLGGRIDSETLAVEEKKIREALRKLWLMLHQDRLEQEPNYKRLSSTLQAELEDIRLRVPPPRRSADLIYKPGQLGYELPSLSQILSDLWRVEEILKGAQIPIKESEQIQGETAQEKIKWLKDELLFLKKAYQEAEDELLIEYENRELEQKELELACPAAYEEIRTRLLSEAERFELQCAALENRLPDGWF